MTIEEIKKLSEAATPEIYKACAHPQSVWFETWWRPILEQRAEAIRFLLGEIEKLKEFEKHCRINGEAIHLFTNEIKLLKAEKDQLREQLKSTQAAKDALVDQLNEFTTAREINGGECLLENKLKPEVDKLREEVQRLTKILHQEFNENDELGAEYLGITMVREENWTLKARCEELVEERDQLREQLKSMEETKDALVDQLEKFTTAIEILRITAVITGIQWGKTTHGATQVEDKKP
jgi:chromosome segregation ATPase